MADTDLQALDVPVAGNPVLDTWGVSAAGKANALGVYCLTSDQATNFSSATDITELEFPVVAGRRYGARIFGSYTVNATNQGLKLGFDNTNGSGRLLADIFGNGGATGSTTISSASGQQGRTSTDSAAPALREVRADFYFVATATGTCKLQFSLGGTAGSPGVTLKEGFGMIVYEMP